MKKEEVQMPRPWKDYPILFFVLCGKNLDFALHMPTLMGHGILSSSKQGVCRNECPLKYKDKTHKSLYKKMKVTSDEAIKGALAGGLGKGGEKEVA